MSTPQYMWNNRAVVFTEFSIKQGREVRAAFAAGDPERGSYLTLLYSARYADDAQTPVFRSIDEIEALPFRLTQKILRLSSAAAEANKVEEADVFDEEGKPVPLH